MSGTGCCTVWNIDIDQKVCCKASAANLFIKNGDFNHKFNDKSRFLCYSEHEIFKKGGSDMSHYASVILCTRICFARLLAEELTVAPVRIWQDKQKKDIT